MNDFKGRHFTGEVILWAVRWYCRYGISYRDLEEMLSERGIDVDHTTIGSVANMGHGRAASPSWGIRQHWRNAY
jgi:transposase-like protein